MQETDFEMDDSNCCPICLLPDQQPLLQTPCHHAACSTCLERIVLATTDTTQLMDDSVNVFQNTTEWQEDLLVASCPTWGRCPFCRQAIYLFDLTEECNEVSGSTRETLWDQDRNWNIAETPLKGCIFQAQDVDLLFKSFVFPSNEATQQEEVVEDEIRTLVNQAQRPLVTLNLLEGFPQDFPSHIVLEPGCFFHEKSNTFHGMIDWKVGYKFGHLCCVLVAS